MVALRASFQWDISSPGGKSGFLVLAWAVAGLSLFSSPAEAARNGQDAAKLTKGKVATLAAKGPEAISSVQADGDGEPYCDSSRKRLFVEGEGWIIRRVTTCY